MKKSILIQIISLLLVFVLVGCNAPVNPSNDMVDTSSNTNATEDTNTDTSIPGNSDNVITDTPADSTEIELSDMQKNAIAMLYHLATTTETIRISKDNRLILEDIYTSLLNEINPGAIDETTQDHLDNIRIVIGNLLNIQSKREQLQYIHNQQKAAAMKEAVPDPLAILSMTNSLNWKKLALNTVFTVVDSYNNYKSANDSADQEFILSGWELDDTEKEVIRKNRDNSFNYMTDIVQQYGSDENKIDLGKLTLNEKEITDFAEICAIEEVYRKIERLTSKEDTYKLFGNYWLELASCYFETENYEKCLNCISKYEDLGIDIFRQDFNIVPLLPKAITAARETYSEKEYISYAQKFADAIIENSSDKDWSVRYFAAQTYMDLFAKTNNQAYLEKAYKVIKENVNLLIDEQHKLNQTYLSDVQKETLSEKEIKKLSKNELKAEQKRIDAYNDSLYEARKTELPPLYEPLVLNCDLLFALANELKIDNSEKTIINKILQTETNGVFLSDAINDKYCFDTTQKEYSVNLEKDKVIINANLLTRGSTITITVVDGKETTVLDDFEIKSVKRAGKTVDSFEAQYDSKKMRSYKWSSNAKIKVEISNGKSFETVVLNYKVKEYKGNWIFPDSVTFEKV
ncbi:MAG: hypothetical protein U0K87_13445 [Ruminococcus sp.]|nr:hypothetical protein [Ruminococcus sp.]